MRIYPSAPIPQNSMLIAGPTLNIKMKQLSNPNVSGINTDYADTKIEYIKRTNNTPGINVSEIIDVAIPGNIPIHMWFDFNNNTLYLKSKCKNIYLNTRSEYTFRNLNTCKRIDLPIIGTYVTNMSTMFAGCTSLTSLDLSHFDTSKVTTMSSMFNGCSKLTSLDLSSFDTSKVVHMNSMFNNCISLNSLDVSNWNTSSVTTMNSMFHNCSSLSTLDVSNWNTSNVTNMVWMFRSCQSLTSLDVSKFNTSKVISMSSMFYNCSSLTSLDVSGFDTSKVTDMSSMFNNCRSLNSLDVSHFDTSKVVHMHYMFYNCPSLTTLDVSNWNTSNVIDMNRMFYSCSSLASLDVSNWNTSNVTSMASMFGGCSSLATIDVSHFDTSKVTDMSYMFNNCKSTSLDVSKFNTSKVTSMAYMFNGCTKLTSLDLSHFDTSNVTNMTNMFIGCTSLTTITYSNNFVLPDVIYDTCIVDDNTNNTYRMFYICNANKPTGGNWDLGAWNSNGAFLSESNLLSGPEFRSLINNDIVHFVSDINVTGDTTLYPTIDGDTRVYLRYNTDQKTQTCVGNNATRVVNLNEDCSGMFKNLSDLTDIDLSHQYFNYNGARTKNWKEMFANDPQLTSIKYPANFGISEDVFLTMFTEDATNPTWHMFYNTPNAPKPTGGYWDMGTWNTEGTFTGGVGVTIDTVLFKAVLNANNSTMVAFKKSDTGPSNMVDVFDISKDRNMSIMLWYDTTSNTQYWYSDNPKVFMDTNSSSMFELPSSNVCASIDLSGLDTSKVTNMSRMFYGCTNVTTLNVSHFDTSNVVNMDYMFINCSSLTSLDVSHFDTSKVTTMHYMFNGCSKLELLDVSGWNTSNVNNMQRMFNNCSALTILDVSHFDTSNVVNMAYMFNNCSSVPLLSISHFNTSNVTNMSRMINNCKSITSLDLSLWDTSNVTDMSYMFSACDKLKSLNIEGFNTSKVLNMAYMFNASPISSLNLSSFDTSAIVYTNGYSAMIGMFRLCQLLIEIEFSNKFILPDAVYQTTTSSANTNGLYNMYQSCYANKPTGGNWDLGTWDDSTGTFIKNA